MELLWVHLGFVAACGFGSVKYQFNPAGIDPGFPDVFLDYSQAMDGLSEYAARSGMPGTGPSG